MTEKKGLPAIAWVAIGCGGLLLLGAIGFMGFTYFVVGKAKSAIEEFGEDPVLGAAAAWARLSPEVELVETDKEARTVTVRTKEGEVFTLDAERINQGDFTVRNEAGEVVFDVDSDGADGAGSVRITGPDGTAVMSAESTSDGSGTVTFSSGDEEVTFRGGEDADQELGDDVLRYPGAEVKGSVSYGGRGGLLTLETSDSPRQVYDYYLERLPREGYSIQSNTWSEQQGRQGGMVIGRDESAARIHSVTVSADGGVTTIVLQVQKP